MKFFLGVLILWPYMAAAVPPTLPNCVSSYLVTPFLTCAHPENGLDVVRQGQYLGELNQWSDFVIGGSDKERVCGIQRDIFNSENAKNGTKATLNSPSFTQERQKDVGIRDIRYSYLCSFTLRKYPFILSESRACGVGPQTFVVPVNSAVITSGQVTCLTCDNIDNLNQKAMCLQSNVKLILERKIDLDSNKQMPIFKSALSHLMSYNQSSPIPFLQMESGLRPFVQFFEIYEK